MTRLGRLLRHLDHRACWPRPGGGAATPTSVRADETRQRPLRAEEGRRRSTGSIGPTGDRRCCRCWLELAAGVETSAESGANHAGEECSCTGSPAGWRLEVGRRRTARVPPAEQGAYYKEATGRTCSAKPSADEPLAAHLHRDSRRRSRRGPGRPRGAAATVGSARPRGARIQAPQQQGASRVACVGRGEVWKAPRKRSSSGPPARRPSSAAGRPAGRATQDGAWARTSWEGSWWGARWREPPWHTAR